MNDDDLLLRLRAIDPLPAGVTIHPTDGPRARALLEDIMTTPTLDPTTTTAPARRRRRWLPAAWAGGAVAVVAAGALAISAIGGGSGGSTAAKGGSITYQLPLTDPLTASCLAVTEFQPPAGMAGLRGKVTGVDGAKVTIEVSKWYAGGDAATVVLNAEGATNAALDGVEFTVGNEYLVAVIDGAVATCGVSGPADPALEQLYAAWFGA